MQVNKAKTFALYRALNHGINRLYSEYCEYNNQCLFLKRKIVIINGQKPVYFISSMLSDTFLLSLVINKLVDLVKDTQIYLYKKTERD